MYRNSEKHLQQWLVKKRRKPLVIRGARQVGKSTLVRNFAKNHDLILLEINLEKHFRLETIFAELNISQISRELSAIVKTEIHSIKNALLFLDEIQATPSAIQALRYFFEDIPDLPVIAAGSLLEFTLADHHFSMPVGRIEYLHLGPMSFTEYLIAKDEKFLLDLITHYELADDISDNAHAQLNHLQREYMLIGGMPEAVLTYLESEQIEQVQSVQDSIIYTYQDDFAKYARQKDLIRLHSVFNYIPRSVGKKVKYSNILPDELSRNVRQTIALLNYAGVISTVYHSHCSGVPLRAEIDEQTYKLLFLDIGLMNRICGLREVDLHSMSDRDLVNEGALAEQFIGQQLLTCLLPQQKPELFYWLREKKAGNAEVDFVVTNGQQVIAVEVKAGKSGTLKSLLQFNYLKKSPVSIRFDLNKPSNQKITHELRQEKKVVSVTYHLLSLPLYLVEQSNQLLENYINLTKSWTH